MTHSDISQQALSKLKWQCRRGVKELDLILEKYLQSHYTNASLQEQEAFESLLTMDDPTLLDLLTTTEKTLNTDPRRQHLLKKLRIFKKDNI